MFAEQRSDDPKSRFDCALPDIPEAPLAVENTRHATGFPVCLPWGTHHILFSLHQGTRDKFSALHPTLFLSLILFFLHHVAAGICLSLPVS